MFFDKTQHATQEQFLAALKDDTTIEIENTPEAWDAVLNWLPESVTALELYDIVSDVALYKENMPKLPAHLNTVDLRSVAMVNDTVLDGVAEVIPPTVTTVKAMFGKARFQNFVKNLPRTVTTFKSSHCALSIEELAADSTAFKSTQLTHVSLKKHFHLRLQSVNAVDTWQCFFSNMPPTLTHLTIDVNVIPFALLDLKKQGVQDCVRALPLTLETLTLITNKYESVQDMWLSYVLPALPPSVTQIEIYDMDSKTQKIYLRSELEHRLKETYTHEFPDPNAFNYTFYLKALAALVVVSALLTLAVGLVMMNSAVLTAGAVMIGAVCLLGQFGIFSTKHDRFDKNVFMDVKPTN